MRTAARLDLPHSASRAEGARRYTPTAGLQLLLNRRNITLPAPVASLPCFTSDGLVAAYDSSIVGLQLLLVLPSFRRNTSLRAATPSSSGSSDDVVQQPSLLHQRWRLIPTGLLLHLVLAALLTLLTVGTCWP